MSVLFVCALPEESAGLPDGAEVVHTGAGKVQAAAALAHHLAGRPDVDLVVNLGTAGGLGHHAPGDVVEVAVVAQHDFDQVALSALVGRSLPGGPIELDGPEGAGGRLATGDRFVASSVERAVLAETADLVDMEGYAVAATCRRFGVAVWITKCVSDSADAQAAVSWAGMIEVASARLAHWAHSRGLLAPR